SRPLALRSIPRWRWPRLGRNSWRLLRWVHRFKSMQRSLPNPVCIWIARIGGAARRRSTGKAQPQACPSLESARLHQRQRVCILAWERAVKQAATAPARELPSRRDQRSPQALPALRCGYREVVERRVPAAQGLVKPEQRDARDLVALLENQDR